MTVEQAEKQIAWTQRLIDLTVKAGLEALERLAEDSRVDLIITDINMPDMNGIEATRQIREQKPHTQVVILSMHATSEHIYQALHAGAIGYLLKDSVGREVVEAVLAAARDERFLSRRITETMLDD